MTMQIQTMTLRHYDALLALWQDAPGVCVHIPGADEKPAIAAYLRRNRGLSIVATDGRRLVGAVLAGHDGRRGILHHLAVSTDYRRQGVGRMLVEEATRRLRDSGIDKAWIVVIADNKSGRRFWKKLGWVEFEDCVVAGKEL